MNLPRIRTLDLRDPAVVYRETHPWEWEGEFPAFPAKLAAKLYPKPQYVTVRIIADTAKLMQQFAEVHARINSLLVERWGPRNPWGYRPVYRYRAPWHWHWLRLVCWPALIAVVYLCR